MSKPVSPPHMLQAFSSGPSDLSLTDPVGIGLRAPHYKDIIETEPNIGWVEVHPENYFCGGIHRHFLDTIANDYPISLHGVGLSLGSDEPVSKSHLKQFKELIDRYKPFNISDHVAWSASGNAHLNDLLPLPYTAETLNKLTDNIKQTQDHFGRAILVENPSTYIAFKDNDMSEQDFMNALCDKAECFMLLDINNIYVQSHNHGLNPYEYINTIEAKYVREMHLSGHIERTAGEHTILVDTHNQEVCDDVWTLYEHAVGQLGVIPTLIEWDQDFPPLQTLLDEADTARQILINKAPEGVTHAAE